MKATTEKHNLRLEVDVPLVLVVLTLVVFGLLMVYSASSSAAVLGRQVLALLLGGAFGFILSRIDYHKLRFLVVPAGILTWALLLVVLIFGEERFNAVRTLFGGSFQPSEIAKPMLIVYLAFWLSSKHEKLHQIFFGLIPMGVIIGATVVLIILQPDFSAALTLILLGILLFFLAGGKLQQTLLVILIVMFMGWLAMNAHIPTIENRMKGYFAGLNDPLQGPEQIKRSFGGIIKGGLFGVGIGKSDLKFTGLPSPSRDSIFVVVVQETGAIMSSLIILLYLVLAWRGSVIAQRAPDLLGSLLAMGLTTWIALEAIINVGMIVGLLPVTGNALPFISAGGSNLACSLIAIGVVMSVARFSAVKETAEGRSFSAVVNLRRGDGGRHVSRPRRSPGSRQ
jgi:cell division protein FtsW